MAAPVPQFCILGGSLSGLTSAFLLQRAFPHSRISVIKQSKCCGSPISSVYGASGHLLEQGFHSSILVNKNGRETLGLVRLLKLDDEVISANIEASARRHLFHRGRVQLFPKLQHTLRYGPALFAEPIWPRGSTDDESVHEFSRRRASSSVADRIADPICVGQLAGDARQLSLRACYPRLWFNERYFHSVFIGGFFSMLPAHKRRSWLSLDLLDPLLQRVSAGGRCYSFRGGLSTLVTRLEERLQDPPTGTRPAEIIENKEIVKFQRLSSPSTPSVEVSLNDGHTLTANTVIAAIHPHEIGRIVESSGFDVPCIGSNGDTFCKLLGKIPFNPVTVVNVGFNSDVFRGRFRGAGYFVGSLERQAIAGMTWDSQLFPEQDSRPGRARLTVYINGEHSKEEAEQVAMEAVRQHLGITEEPEEVCSMLWPEAAPQYPVGHLQTMRTLNAARVQHLPWLQFAGAGYFGTRAVADEVVDARELVDALGRRFARFPGLIENEVEEDVSRRYAGGFDTG